MADNSEERTLPEEVGLNMIISSIIGIVSTTIVYIIILFFFASASLESQNIILKIAVSILLTTIIPTVLYRYGRKAITELMEGLLTEGMGVRGKADRTVVFVGLLLAVIGGWLFLFSPLFMEPATNVHPIYAFMNSKGTYINAIESLYVDLMSVFGFGIFAGSLTISWYRYAYPRQCQNCGKREPVEGDYCRNCDAPSYALSRSENLKGFLLNTGIRNYGEGNSDDEN